VTISVPAMAPLITSASLAATLKDTTMKQESRLQFPEVLVLN